MPDRTLSGRQYKLFEKIKDQIANHANFLYGSGIYKAGYSQTAYAHPMFYCELKESQVGNPHLDMDEVERIAEIALNNVIERYTAEIVEVQIERKVISWQNSQSQ